MFHPGHVADFVPDPLIQADEKIYRVLPVSGETLNQRPQERSGRVGRAVGLEILGHLRGIVKRVGFESRFQKKCERIDGSQVRNQVYLNGKLGRPVRKKDPGEMIRMRVELPVANVIGGSNVERVAEDGRAAVWGRAQLYDLGAERNGLVISIPGPVMHCNLYTH